MRTDTFKDVTRPQNQVLWLLLAFQGGFMNAGGYLAVHRFVSHVTGYGTNVGVELGRKNYLGAFELMLAPLMFLAGAAYSGYLVDRRVIQEREPRVELGILSLALINLFIYLAEFSGMLGTFGEPLVLQRDFFLLFCLCFACGVQNGLFTGLTHGQVRTTHLTGPITDIGLNLTKIFSLPRFDEERDKLAKANWLRTKIVLAFSGGSLIAVLVFEELTYEGFAIPCAISFFLVWYVKRLMKISGDPRTSEHVAEIRGNVQDYFLARQEALLVRQEELIARQERLLDVRERLAIAPGGDGVGRDLTPLRPRG